jgi:nucleotide-binding universal stress UspA family protein
MKRILTLTDFSEVAENATRYSLELVKRLKCELEIYHAREFEESDSGKKLLQTSRELMREVPGAKVTIKTGEQLFSAASIGKEIAGASLLVIGSARKHVTVQKKLFGTHSEEISENARFPVLVIPESAQFNPIGKIAFASDFYHIEREITPVVHFAKKFSARLMVFHVEPVFPDLGKTETRNLEKEVEQLKSSLGYRDIEFYHETTRLDNQVHKGIHHFITAHQPDVLVLYHEYRKGFDNFISTTETGKAVAHLELPILIMHRESRLNDFFD